MFPMMPSLTSFAETVTQTREPGPFQSSSARVLARYPPTIRFRSGFELNWRADWTQWLFVTMRPSPETNDALQFPSVTRLIDSSAPDGGPTIMTWRSPFPP